MTCDMIKTILLRVVMFDMGKAANRTGFLTNLVVGVSNGLFA